MGLAVEWGGSNYPGYFQGFYYLMPLLLLFSVVGSPVSA